MASINSGNADVLMLYGGPSDALGRQSATAQLTAEALTVSLLANARKFKGPKANGHFSIQVFNDSASGATSALTVWYSNLFDPDPAVDAHWTQDTSITSVDLTATGSTFINVGNVNAEWVRVKPATVTTAGTLRVFVRSEGCQNR